MFIVYISNHRTSPATTERSYIVKAIPEAIISERNVSLVKKGSKCQQYKIHAWPVPAIDVMDVVKKLTATRICRSTFERGDISTGRHWAHLSENEKNSRPMQSVLLLLYQLYYCWLSNWLHGQPSLLHDLE